jgi:hypothetical protein
VGVGAGENYQAHIGQHYGSLPNPPLEKMEPDTHNVYLLIASQMGLLGLFALLYLVFDFMSRARRVGRAQPKGYPAALAMGLWGCLLSFLLYSLWGTILTRGTYLVLVTLLALIATLERLYAPPPPEPARPRKPKLPPAPKVPPTPLGGEEEEVSPAEADEAMSEVESLRELLASGEEGVSGEADTPDEDAPSPARPLPTEESGTGASAEERKEGTVSWLDDEAGPEAERPSGSSPPPTAPKS